MEWRVRGTPRWPFEKAILALEQTDCWGLKGMLGDGVGKVTQLGLGRGENGQIYESHWLDSLYLETDEKRQG